MAESAVPMNLYDLQIETATDVWTDIKGITSLTVSITGTEVDAGTFDTGEWGSFVTTGRGGSVSVQGRTLFDAADGSQDPGQAAVESLAYQIGSSAVGSFRLLHPGGIFGIAIDGSVGNHQPYGGGKDDLAGWSVDIKIQGAPTPVDLTPAS